MLGSRRPEIVSHAADALTRHVENLRRAPFTLAIVFTLMGVFAATWAVGGAGAVRHVFSAGLFANDEFCAGQWWRLFSSELVHRDWDHVLWNGVGLLIVGIAVEPRLGTRRTAVIYLLGAIGADAASFVFCTRGGGASGAIFALIGAYLAGPLNRWKSGTVAVRLGWPFAVWWVYRRFTSDPQYYEACSEAHVAGLVVGMCCGAFFGERTQVETGHWGRPLRFAAATLASLALIAALAPDPRWGLGWTRNAAKRAENAHDLKAATREWGKIEANADARRPVDAVFIENAARFKLRRHKPIEARVLLCSVAPTLNTAKLYRDAGFLLSQEEPTDERAAFGCWRKAVELDPNLSEVCDAMARAIACDDSTLGSPEEALALARRAVALDGMQSPYFLRTLAWTHHRCGDVDKSVLWMRRAIRRNPQERELFESELATFEHEQARRQPPPGKKT